MYMLSSFFIAESHDPLFSSEYAPDIYQYMREREVCGISHLICTMYIICIYISSSF